MIFLEKNRWKFFLVALVGVFLGVAFQIWASQINSRCGFGFRKTYSCEKCGELVQDIDGVYLSDHWFYISRRVVLKKGDLNCEHSYRRIAGSGHADGDIPKDYFFFLKNSHRVFFLGGIFFAFSLIGFLRARVTKQNFSLGRPTPEPPQTSPAASARPKVSGG